MMDKNARIFIAGHKGLLGSALVRCLTDKGFTQLLLPARSTLELTDAASVDEFFQKNKPDYVLLAAGKVGGIVENQRIPAEFLDQNLAIQRNAMRAAQQAGVRKLVFFASSCMYPRECEQAMKEELLLSGKPEPTSLAYAVAKLAGLQLCLAYNQQYGEQRFIPVIPNSAYGPNDNFDPASGHVLSALIRRFHDAKSAGADTITLWGSGKPRREFVHADDIAQACLMLLAHEGDNLELPINIGVSKDYSIQELAGIVARVVGFSGAVHWDTSKPDGVPRKLLDSSRMKTLGWQPRIALEDGIRNTYSWYLGTLKGANKESAA